MKQGLIKLNMIQKVNENILSPGIHRIFILNNVVQDNKDIQINSGIDNWKRLSEDDRNNYLNSFIKGVKDYNNQLSQRPPTSKPYKILLQQLEIDDLCPIKSGNSATCPLLNAPKKCPIPFPT